jgi:vitamin-K-epoxide reductase (warfarin-sensitive)
MKITFVILALLGITASFLALREHYRPYGDSPCDINEHWDCGIVNHSPYAVIYGVPVATIGMAGYLLLGALALKRAYRLMLVFAIPALAFSLYLARIEAHDLGVWCLYCVISLGVISLMTILLSITGLLRVLSPQQKGGPCESLLRNTRRL